MCIYRYLFDKTVTIVAAIIWMDRDRSTSAHDQNLLDIRYCNRIEKKKKILNVRYDTACGWDTILGENRGLEDFNLYLYKSVKLLLTKNNSVKKVLID